MLHDLDDRRWCPAGRAVEFAYSALIRHCGLNAGFVRRIVALLTCGQPDVLLGAITRLSHANLWMVMSTAATTRVVNVLLTAHAEPGIGGRRGADFERGRSTRAF
jgi:hypothetical protein